MAPRIARRAPQAKEAGHSTVALAGGSRGASPGGTPPSTRGDPSGGPDGRTCGGLPCWRRLRRRLSHSGAFLQRGAPAAPCRRSSCFGAPRWACGTGLCIGSVLPGSFAQVSSPVLPAGLALWARSLGSLPGPPACPLPAWPRGDCPGGGLRDGLGGPNGPFGQGAGLRGPIVRSGQKPGLGARKEPLHGFGADGEPALTPPICIPKLHRESPVWACRQVCAPDHPRASWGVRVQRFRTLHGRPFPRWGRLEGSFQIARVVRNRRVKLMLISPLRLRADPLGAPLMG